MGLQATRYLWQLVLPAPIAQGPALPKEGRGRPLEAKDADTQNKFIIKDAGV